MRDINEIKKEFNEAVEMHGLEAILFHDIVIGSTAIKVGKPGFINNGGDFLQVKSMNILSDDINGQLDIIVAKLYMTVAKKNFYTYFYDILDQLKKEDDNGFNF